MIVVRISYIDKYATSFIHSDTLSIINSKLASGWTDPAGSREELIGKTLLRAAFEANLPLLGGLWRANSTIDSRVLGPAAAVVDRRVGQLPKYVLVGAPSSAAGVAARGRPGVRVPISQSDQPERGTNCSQTPHKHSSTI